MFRDWLAAADTLKGGLQTNFPPEATRGPLKEMGTDTGWRVFQPVFFFRS